MTPVVDVQCHDVESVNNWLMAQALIDSSVETLLAGCCTRLCKIGLPLWRGYLAFRTLHPLYEAQGLTWLDDGRLTVEDHQHGSGEGDGWRLSPLYHLVQTDTPSAYYRLDETAPRQIFPLLATLADAGATGYRCFFMPFSKPKDLGEPEDGVVGSWTTRQPEGFAPIHRQALERVETRLAVASKVAVREATARNVLDAYLGKGTGRRVLTGQIKRGDGNVIPAVVLFSDLRQSTALAEHLSLQAYLDLLNQFLECLAETVQAHGGEVLRYIGDAVLAIFPITTDQCATTACQAALDATADAQARLAHLNTTRQAAGLTPIDYGIGLHLGDVMYGNIGSRDRLEFTVIGRAANEAARLEGLCKTLQQPVLMSAAVAKQTRQPVVSLGRHQLAGVDTACEVFRPAQS